MSTETQTQTPAEKAGVNTTLVETITPRDGHFLVPARFAVKSYGNKEQFPFPFDPPRLTSWQQIVEMHGGDETVALAGVEAAWVPALKEWAKQIVEARTANSMGTVLTDIQRKHSHDAILKYLAENCGKVTLPIPAEMREEITRRKMEAVAAQLAEKEKENENLKARLAALEAAAQKKSR